MGLKLDYSTPSVVFPNLGQPKAKAIGIKVFTKDLQMNDAALDALLQTPVIPTVETPLDFVPYTDAELLGLQDRILKANKGDKEVVKPTKEELERAFSTIRHKRNAVGAPKEKKSSTKSSVAPMSAQELASLFGSPPK